jgi:hypothetical protein
MLRFRKTNVDRIRLVECRLPNYPSSYAKILFFVGFAYDPGMASLDDDDAIQALSASVRDSSSASRAMRGS